MVVLRCTKKLLSRLGGVTLVEETPRSSTRLGDWTASVITIDRQQLVIAVSNTTLLPVLLPLAPAKTLRLPVAVGQVLQALEPELERRRISSEMQAMAESVLADTNDRRVVGSLVEFIRMLDGYLDGRSLVEVALHLSEAPCGPIGMDRPRDRVAALLSSPTLQLLK